jgi:hypothetical protein
VSDAVLVAIVAAIPSTLAVLMSLRNSGKLTQIHTLTNSNLQEVKRALQVAQEKIAGLEALVVSLAPRSG